MTSIRRRSGGRRACPRFIALAALLAPVTLLATDPPVAPARAKNVILFLADAGGIPTLHAASLHGYGEAGRLFVQQMPHIGLSDTSTASQWVTDSAAGMTAIVTGQRTHNGVLSQSAAAVRGQSDGAPLKTILEHAEERGLATGIISNDSVVGATPAALYAKSNDRGKAVAIFLQLFSPRFGDGVDVLIGAGREPLLKAAAADGHDLVALGESRKRPLLDAVEAIPAGAGRALVLTASSDFDLGAAVRTAMRILSRNPRGYFLMVECDVHTNRLRRGLDRMVAFDRVIRDVAAAAGPATLVLFTADHSFDIRVRGGKTGAILLEGLEAAEGPAENAREARLPNVRVENGHTGDEVLVAARGPGAARVWGYMANTDLFAVMMRAFGWPCRGCRVRSPRG